MTVIIIVIVKETLLLLSVLLRYVVAALAIIISAINVAIILPVKFTCINLDFNILLLLFLLFLAT